MANRKRPDKEAFKKELDDVTSSLPQAYSVRVLEKLAKSGKLAMLVQRQKDNGTYSPTSVKVYINNVRLGRAVDWDVLAAFKEIAKEVRELQLQLA